MVDKIEYAWVIQRDDGKYFNIGYNSKQEKCSIFVSSISGAWIDDCIELALDTIECFNLQNCKPLKIEIKVVEND